jgi:NADPH-dependent curcumin reductase CurA
MNRNGRLLAYGASAAQYSTDAGSTAAGRRSLRQAFVGEAAEPILAAKNVKVEAWIVHDFYHERIAAENDLSRLLLTGAIRPVHNTVEGFENLPLAVVSLYTDARAGKLQIRF